MRQPARPCRAAFGWLFSFHSLDSGAANDTNACRLLLLAILILLLIRFVKDQEQEQDREQEGRPVICEQTIRPSGLGSQDDSYPHTNITGFSTSG